MAGKQAAVRRQPQAKQERLEARISADQKDLFLQAAEAQGRTLTDFVIASVHAAAVRTLEEMRAVRLTAAESRAFAEAMLHPQEPGSRLRAAARRYMAAAGTAEPG